MKNDLSFSNLGASQSDYDYRDHKDAELAMAAPAPATFKTDLSQIPVAEFTQGKIGICTSSLVSYVEWLYWKKTGVYTKLSRRFLYSVGKNLIDENNIEGSSLRTMLKVAYNYGICPDSVFPSDVGNMTHAQYMDFSAIPNEAWKAAKPFMIGGYINVPTDTDSMKAHLAKYGMLYAMKQVGKEWWTSPSGEVTWDPAKINPIRPPQQVVSGHAMNYTGYDISLFELLNDWGLPWCNKDFANFFPDKYPTIEAWAVTLDRIANDLPPADQFHHTFNTAMERSTKYVEEVKYLQIALMISGDLDYVQPSVRGYYGQQTQEAVLRYQLRKKLPLSWIERYVYAGRYCGAKTLGALNADFA